MKQPVKTKTCELPKNTYPAPAKLNLFLHITGRRPDGYHNLQTIFQFIDYNDTLSFELRENDELSCDMTDSDLPNEHNLVTKAARLLKQHVNYSGGVHVCLEKRIPLGGGLGGGSSNAATTLFALNQLWNLHLPYDTLIQLGVKLGADVPIFLYGQAAWAEGIGEQLTPISLEEPWYLIIHPNCQVPTAEIFTAPELTRNMPPVKMSDFLTGRTQNVCEAVVRVRYPEIGRALDWLNQYGIARLTGTGACVFAAFNNSEQAHQVLTNLPNQWQGFVAQGKNVSPLLSGIVAT